jgi:hypothetical protein
MTAPFSRRASLCATAALLLIAHTGQSQTLENALPEATTPPPAGNAAIPQPVLPSISPKQSASAESAFLAGAKHLRDSDFKQAEDDFARAVTLDPSKPDYLASLVLAREHRVTSLIEQAAEKRVTDPAAADKLIAEARSIDSTNPRVLQHSTPRAINSPVPAPIRTNLGGAITLQHNNTVHSYHQRADINILATQIAADYGFRIIPDPDLKSQQYRIDVDDASYADAFSVFNLLTKTMLVPLDAHTAILAEDTTANRTRYDRMVEETFYLPGYSADQMKDFVSIAQTIFDIKQVSAQPLNGALVVRGPADIMDAVERVFADLLSGSSDVMVDVKVYEVNKQHIRNLGVVLPQTINGFSVAAEAQSIISSNSSLITQLQSTGVIPSTATNTQIAEYLVLSGLVSSSAISNAFLIFGGGATTGAISVGNVPTMNLALSDADARTLDDLELRASDRQKVTFTTGLRYPIQTSLFSDIASSTTSGLAGLTVNGVSVSSLLAQYLGTSSSGSSAVIPQVQYQDLGFTVETTPRILHNAEIGMALNIKITALAGTSLNGIPILTSRQFTSDITVKDGETAMMVSDVTDQEIAAVTGLPGVSEVPGFQSTTNDNGTRTTGDLVVMITPHIVRLGHPSGMGPYIPITTHPDND